MTDFTRTAHQLADNYLAALAAADLPGVLALFSPDGEVISPLYGRQSAADFYVELFADTQRSEVSFTDVLTHDAHRSLALLFDYRWTLASGKVIEFEVMDYCLLDTNGKITELRIIYDTARTREVWTKEG